MTADETPVEVTRHRGAAVTSTGTNDADILAALLAEEQHIVASLSEVERLHALDITSPAILAIDRARATAEQLAIELRIAFRYLGGVP